MNLSKGAWAFTAFIGLLMVVAIVAEKPTATGGRTRRTNAIYGVLIVSLLVYGLTVAKDIS